MSNQGRRAREIRRHSAEQMLLFTASLHGITTEELERVDSSTSIPLGVSLEDDLFSAPFDSVMLDTREPEPKPRETKITHFESDDLFKRLLDELRERDKIEERSADVGLRSGPDFLGMVNEEKGIVDEDDRIRFGRDDKLKSYRPPRRVFGARRIGAVVKPMPELKPIDIEKRTIYPDQMLLFMNTETSSL